MLGQIFATDRRTSFKMVFATLSLVSSLALAQPAPTNPWGGEQTPKVNHDRNVAVPRGYIIPRAEAVAGGAKVTVEIFHKDKNDPVSLWLQAAINDGKGAQVVIALEQLSVKVSDNPNDYYSSREYIVNYDQLNQKLAQIAPNLAHLKIGPGTPLFVYAQFDPTGHQWGGVGRGGIVYMPGDTSAPVATNSATAARPKELDLAFPIYQTLANLFNDAQTNSGLKVGGQIRSRVEAEGKFQLTLEQFDTVRDELFKIAKDPSLAASIIGQDWTMKLEDRYMLRDSSGQLKLDAKGFPTPDPMVDTYYDNDTFDAAKNDMAVRYRWTEGNATGAWNFKPGLTVATNEGVVYRVEYGVESTDDKPGTLAKYADSMHPLNPFQMIRDIVPGSTPSDFLKPAVKITDYRYKFKMEHKNGLIIELSLDDVQAASLRGDGSQKPVRYVQMEMDIDHLATKSTNQGMGSNTRMTQHYDLQYAKPLLQKMDAQAFFDGRPVMHNVSDLDPQSPIRIARDAEFKLATQAINGLRDRLLGKEWLAGPQKYAFAAHALRLTSQANPSTSVKSVLDGNATNVTAGKGGTLVGSPCADLFKP